jgi:hypothetical protein
VLAGQEGAVDGSGCEGAVGALGLLSPAGDLLSLSDAPDLADTPDLVDSLGASEGGADASGFGACETTVSVTGLPVKSGAAADTLVGKGPGILGCVFCDLVGPSSDDVAIVVAAPAALVDVVAGSGVPFPTVEFRAAELRTEMDGSEE